MEISVKQLSEEEISKRNIRQWPIWQKEVSKFDWYYSETEECLFLEGKVKIYYKDKVIEVGKGDFVTFPQGLECVWEVSEPVRKHYNFQ